MIYKEGNLRKTTYNKQKNYFSNKTIPKDSAQLNDTGSFKQETKYFIST